MDDGSALLAAVKDRPDDDTPRLVYADYLDDQGEENYAAFIRCQVEMARHPEWSLIYRENDQEARRLFPLVKHLIQRDGDLDHGSFEYEECRRWFFDILRVFGNNNGAQQFVRHGEAMLAASPARTLNLLVGDMPNEQALRSPHWGQLRRIHFKESYVRGNGRMMAATIGAAKNIYSLKTDSIPANFIEPLTQMPTLANLRDLNLTGQFGFGDDLQRIATCRHLSQLEQLALHIQPQGTMNNTARDLTRFFNAGNYQLKNLKQLSLVGSMSDASVTALLNRHGDQLKCLRLIDGSVFGQDHILSPLRRHARPLALEKLEILIDENPTEAHHQDTLADLGEAINMPYLTQFNMLSKVLSNKWCVGPDANNRPYFERYERRFLNGLFDARRQNINAMPNLLYVNNKPVAELAQEHGMKFVPPLGPVPPLPPDAPGLDGAAKDNKQLPCGLRFLKDEEKNPLDPAKFVTPSSHVPAKSDPFGETSKPVGRGPMRC